MPWIKPYKPPDNQRLDPKIYEQTGWITFITIHAFLRKAPFVYRDMNLMIINTLQEEQERQKCSTFAYCLMPDHLHYLITPLEDGISILKFTDQFKGKTTNRSWKLGCQKNWLNAVMTGPGVDISTLFPYDFPF